MADTAYSEHEIELLTDLRDNPSYELFTSKVIPELLRSHLSRMMRAVQQGDGPTASYAAGRYAGVVDTLEILYRKIKAKTPVHINELRRLDEGLEL